MTKAIIVGAGITGLCCAWRLQRLGVECLILESSNRAGGVIQSQRENGYLIERGPNSLLPSDANFAILDETGLTADLVEGDRRAPRFVCIDGELRKVPLGPMSGGGILRAVAEPFIRSKSTAEESIQEFFVRRFGSQVEDRLVSPFVTGIYAGNTAELSMRANFPKLVQMERDHGSLILGMLFSRRKSSRRSRTCSFPDGMETLPKRLVKDLQIVYEAQSVHVQRNLDVSWSAGSEKASAVVVTTPAYTASRVLEQSIPGAVRLLEEISYAPMIVAIASLPDSAFPVPLRGFGFLVPRSEKRHLLGTIFNSAIFPDRAPPGEQLFTSFIGGALEREAIQWSDERVWNVVAEELRAILKLKSEPKPVSLIRRTHAIPQYTIGHEDRVAAIREELRAVPGLFLGGNYLDGVSVSWCMESGERLARDVAEYLRSKS